MQVTFKTQLPRAMRSSALALTVTCCCTVVVGSQELPKGVKAASKIVLLM